LLQPGQTLDRHVVDAVIGEGGMAVVYRVHHAELGTPHALKVLTLTRKQVRERFVQEGRVQATLRHPNIVSVFDLFEVEGAPALLMELIEGPSLAERLASGPMAPAEAEEIFRGIVTGVAEAHKHGLVHRDLKPANVLLATVNGVVVPKVADFGLVKLRTDDDSATRSGMTMGTPAYMAPEQIKDAKRVDARADVWSLGCILYELVTGRAPFRGDDVLAIMMAATSGEYEPPEKIAPDLPERFRKTIAGCLRVDPDQRLSDCAAVLRALSGEATPAPTPKPAAPAARRPTADPRVLLPVGLAVVGLGAMVGVVLVLAVAVGASSWTAPSAVAPLLGLDDGPCGGRPGEVVGWANHRMFFFKKKGATWTLPNEREIYARRPETEEDALPGSGDVVCTLPKGTKVRLMEAPVNVGATGTWIPVTAGEYDLPQPDTDKP
jgi:hypothetical protein